MCHNSLAYFGIGYLPELVTSYCRAFPLLQDSLLRLVHFHKWQINFK